MCKRLIALFSCLSLLLFAGGCGKSATEKPYIAVIVKAVDSDFWHNVQRGVEAAATEYNVSATFEGPENEEDYVTQNAMIARAVTDGAKAIVLSAIDYVRCADAVDDAVRRGVKVITIDSDVDSQLKSQFIGTDNYAAGQAAARAAVSLFPDTTPVCIGIVNYMTDTDNGKQREDGFRKYVDSVPRARVVAAVTAGGGGEPYRQCDGGGAVAFGTVSSDQCAGRFQRMDDARRRQCHSKARKGKYGVRCRL